nr:MAG TPA: hypothetical protein [Caudoviricetes sp.]
MAHLPVVIPVALRSLRSSDLCCTGAIRAYKKDVHF